MGQPCHLSPFGRGRRRRRRVRGNYLKYLLAGSCRDINITALSISYGIHGAG